MIKKIYSKRLRAHVWAFDLRCNGRRLRDSGFVTKREAEEAASVIRLAARADKYGLAREHAPVTWDELIAQREKGADDPNRKHAVVTLRKLRDALPSARLVQLTAADLQRYVEQRQLDGLSGASINRELHDISAALSFACGFFPALADWQRPAMPYIPRAEKRRERVLTEGEAGKLLDWLRRQCQKGERKASWQVRLLTADVLELALLTGMRLKELLLLRWSDCNFPWRTLRVDATKTNTIRVIPMSAMAQALIERRQREQSVLSEFVFTGLCGNTGLLLRNGIIQALQRAAVAVGIAYGRAVAGGFVLHDARHTATSAMLHEGVDLATIQSITGHSAKTMALRYGHATTASRQAAVEALARFGVHLESTLQAADSEKSVQSEDAPWRKSA